MSDPAIPLELVEHIISNITDTQTLTSCSSVCHTWLPIARPRLFSEATFKICANDPCRELVHLLSSATCTIEPYIRRLLLEGSNDSFPLSVDDSTLSVLRNLTHIRSVEVRWTTWECISSLGLEEIIASYDLISLHVSFVTFPRLGNFAHFITRFQNLEVLDIGNMAVGYRCSDDFDFAILKSLRPLESLRTLAINGSQANLMTMLTQLSPRDSMDTLSLCSLSSTSQQTYVDDFIDRISVKHLALNYSKVYAGPVVVIPNLSSQLQLRSLNLQGLVSSKRHDISQSRAWAACIAILSTVKSRRMESLTLHFDTVDCYAIQDWNTLDDILESETFKKVKQVTFRIPYVASFTASLPLNPEFISAHLPKAYERGVLDFNDE